jgi:magnesium transporter
MKRGHKRDRLAKAPDEAPQGPETPPEPVITIIDYDETGFNEAVVGSIEEIKPYLETPTVSWINIRGLPGPEAVEGIGKLFGLHPLIIEDMTNTGQRPRLEDMVDYLYLTVKTFRPARGSERVKTEQTGIVVGRRFVLSIEEGAEDPFEPVREKLRKYRGRIRKMGTDYLAYRLLDAIVDGYFEVLEALGERIEALEERVISNPTPDLLHEIQRLRTEMAQLYRSVWPLREVVGALTRDDLPQITKATTAYFRDVYDHTVQIIETMETDRDLVSGMLDIYVSSVSNRMNEIMKVLTIIATIFIPMTFVAGVYGMNFKNMPEYGTTWAYPAFWALIVAMGVFMLLYFRRKKWL